MTTKPPKVFADLRKRLATLGKARILVGVLGDAASRAHPNGHGQTVGQIAAANHYGTSTAPARPFLTQTARTRDADIRRVVGKALKLEDPAAAADLIGAYVVGLVQETISDGVPPPNAPETIARKGSSTPLIDTGILRQSISYEVR